MEKPLECSSCTEKASVIYKTLYSQNCQSEVLCKHCPLLTEKLVGKNQGQGSEIVAEVLCNECGTPLYDVLKKDPLGCEHCYEVFKDVICKRINIEKFDYKQDVMTNNKITPSSEQLLKLSKDLQEAVDTENFEKAAIIRDEIIKLKKLMSES
jgi:protein arginine kinase activator